MRLVLHRLLRLSTAQIRDHGDQHAALAGAAARLAARRATPGRPGPAAARPRAARPPPPSDGERRRAENHLQIEIAAVAQSPLLFREEVGMQAEMGPLLWLGPGHDAVHGRPTRWPRRSWPPSRPATATGRGRSPRSAWRPGPPTSSSSGSSTGSRRSRHERRAGASSTAFVTDTRGVVAGSRARPRPRSPGRATPGRADLADLEPPGPGGPRAAARRLLHGGGFVAAPHVLADAPWWLEWFAWDAGAVQRLVPETDPAGAHFFDYTLMPWYSGPRDHPDGPAVDHRPVRRLPLHRRLHAHVHRAGGRSRRRLRGGGRRRRPRLGRRAAVPGAAARRCPGRSRWSTSSGGWWSATRAAMISGDLVTDLDVPALAACGDPRLTRIAGSELALLDPRAGTG